jgi:hypothetical protein
MKIDTGVLQPVAAVVSSVLLLIAGRQRIFEVIALLASAVWLAITLTVFKWPISSVKPGLAIGGALLVSGVVVYLKTSNKREVTASTVIAILGGILVFGALG